MSHEFFAHYAKRWDNHEDKDAETQVILLCEGILENKKSAQEKLKKMILANRLDKFLEQQRRTFHDLLSYNLPDLRMFPVGSFTLEFTFYLDKPYISTDDTSFYIIDNPLKREKVFKLPYIAPSQWKGILRSTVREQKGYKTWEEEDKQMVRIFGNIKKEKEHENLSKGALYFYPTYFDKIGLEVINPHDCKTGAGTQPIYFESVPIGASGTFSLFYFPSNRDEKNRIDDMLDDLTIISEGICKMMTTHGVGAQVSSGFGRVKEIKAGNLTIKIGKVKRVKSENNIISISFGSFNELIEKIEELKREDKR
jgi:CRISPR-associated protein Cmr2